MADISEAVKQARNNAREKICHHFQCSGRVLIWLHLITHLQLVTTTTQNHHADPDRLSVLKLKGQSPKGYNKTIDIESPCCLASDDPEMYFSMFPGHSHSHRQCLIACSMQISYCSGNGLEARLVCTHTYASVHTPVHAPVHCTHYANASLVPRPSASRVRIAYS